MIHSAIAYVGLGSNLGDRLAMLRRAVAKLRQVDGLVLDPRRVASLWETDPVGGPSEQGAFYNCALELRASLVPRELLEVLLQIERSLGRTRATPNESRVIDLDLLLYDDLVSDTPTLRIPHPRMHQRRFVLEPLAELAPDLIHPVLRQSLIQLRAEAETSIPRQQAIRIMGPEWALLK